MLDYQFSKLFSNRNNEWKPFIWAGLGLILLGLMILFFPAILIIMISSIFMISGVFLLANAWRMKKISNFSPQTIRIKWFD